MLMQLADSRRNNSPQILQFLLRRVRESERSFLENPGSNPGGCLRGIDRFDFTPFIGFKSPVAFLDPRSLMALVHRKIDSKPLRQLDLALAVQRECLVENVVEGSIHTN